MLLTKVINIIQIHIFLPRYLLIPIKILLNEPIKIKSYLPLRSDPFYPLLNAFLVLLLHVQSYLTI